jgi:hypothetical protein
VEIRFTIVLAKITIELLQVFQLKYILCFQYILIMHRINFKVYFIGFCFSLYLASCSKSNDTDTNTSIVGNWNYAEVGMDDNNNNVLDAGETTPVGQFGAYGSAIFTATTYSFTYFDGANPYDETGTYTYTNGTLVTTTAGGTSNTYNVNTLTNNRLVVREAFSHPAFWTVMTK